MCRLSPFQSVSQVSGQNVDELGVGRWLLKFSPSNQVQKAVVGIASTALNKSAKIALHTARRCVEMLRRLHIKSLCN